jgi:amidophosphoribosyltransferase
VKAPQDNLGHYCGVAGIYSVEPTNIPERLFYPLFSLQHRGQESAGIAYRKESDRTVVYKDLGMVSSVLSRYLHEEHVSHAGIGHVRYSTNGGNKLENAQPIAVTCNKGDIALAHNGNIANMPQIKSRLFAEGSIFQTSSDTELILHLLSRSRRGSFREALFDTLQELDGAYTMTMLHDNTLVAIRDPWGFRPLYIGTKEDVVVVASESCALDILAISDWREVRPGEILFINDQGIESTMLPRSEATRQCAFELIYFARPDSQIFGHSVHEIRKRMGRALAADDTVTGDVVIPVPDSGSSAALGYAEAAGIPFDFGLTRNHYAGRSFIMPTTAERELAVRMKLHPVREVIAGKRIILVDDSLVRGTTARMLVKLLVDAGAEEVHLRLSSPEIMWPCFFGIDIPTRSELISNRLSPEEIAAAIRADTVRFLPLERLAECVGNSNSYCFACFSGNYPMEVPLSEEERQFDRRTAVR